MDDDGINSAIQVCHLLSNQNKKMSEIKQHIKCSFCKDKEKYQVVDDIVNQIKEIKKNKTKIDGQVISEVLTVNGIRFSFEDGSMGTNKSIFQ